MLEGGYPTQFCLPRRLKVTAGPRGVLAAKAADSGDYDDHTNAVAWSAVSVTSFVVSNHDEKRPGVVGSLGAPKCQLAGSAVGEKGHGCAQQRRNQSMLPFTKN